MNWIQHIIEPKRLLLTWQPKAEDDRMRRIVGELIKTNGKVCLHYLKDSSDFKDATLRGFTGYPAFPLEATSYDNVLEIFTRRLPPKTRTDRRTYLDSIRIPLNMDVSEFALLGYSGAKVPDDDFNLIHPFEDAAPPCELLTEVAGFRHNECKDLFDSIHVDAEVEFKKEPENPKDPMAIAVFSKEGRLGYINRGLLPTFHQWINEGREIKGVIERKNGTSQKPKVYVFISVR